MSGIINKVKEAISHDKHDKPSHSTNAGPHDSNVANKLDPRVDSDRDGRAAYGTAATGGTTGVNTGNTYTQNQYTSGSTNAGPHNSNLANKLDPRVDSDLDGRAAAHGPTAGYTGVNTAGMNTNTTTTGNHTYGTTGSTNAGPHNTNIGNKLDPRIDSDLDGRAAHHTVGTTGTTTGAATGGYTTGSANNGPHNSKLMNKLDPRVDSDRDGRNAFGTTGSADTTTKSFEQSQTQSTPTSTTAHGAGSTNHGPHNSNLLNKLDPRVDSDRDHRAAPTHTTTPGITMGIAGTGGVGPAALGTSTTGHAHNTHHGNHGHHGHHSHNTLGTSTSTSTTTAGPHDSNLANKLDPRVDSDMDNRARHQHIGTMGGATGVSTTGGYATAGPHDSNLANKLDPRIDSDLDNRARHQHMGTMGTTTTAPAGSSYATIGTGNTTVNAGPHNSKLLNKLDPRVDSDLDGSRTVGNTQRQY